MVLKPSFLSRRGDSKIASTAIIDRTIVAENPEGGESPNKKDGPKTILLSRRGDSNARPLRPERSALPTALLLAHFVRFDYLLAQKNSISQKRVQRYCFFLNCANFSAIILHFFA